MFDFHQDKKRYFDWQYQVSRDYVLPFLSENGIDVARTRVLEVGCGEAGVLKAFLEKGCSCHGIELSPHRVALANQFYMDDPVEVKPTILNKNVYDIDPESDFDELFDIIILKDVIEHIPDQNKFLSVIQDFLTTKGVIFFGFPPWQMPFGGHQQIAKSKIYSKLPYIHLLPRILYKASMKLFGEDLATKKELLEIYDTSISIEQFEQYAKNQRYEIIARKHWLINPIYKLKFGLKVREQSSIITAIPFIRNFVTTCAYYILTKQKG